MTPGHSMHVGDNAEVVGGIQKSPDRLPRHNHRPYLTVRNVQRGRLDLSHVERFEVSETELARLRLRTVQTKRKLLDECDLYAIVSLPPGTFVNAGAGVKTNLLFFTRGRPTERIWYYDLSPVKVGKKTPLTLAHFEECLRLLPERADSEWSWSVTRAEIEAKGYDLKAVNPHARSDEDRRTPEELLDLIEARGREVAEAVAALRALRRDA